MTNHMELRNLGWTYLHVGMRAGAPREAPACPTPPCQDCPKDAHHHVVSVGRGQPPSSSWFSPVPSAGPVRALAQQPAALRGLSLP